MIMEKNMETTICHLSETAEVRDLLFPEENVAGSLQRFLS